MAAGAHRAGFGAKGVRARPRRANDVSRCCPRDGDLRAAGLARPIRAGCAPRKSPAQSRRALRRHHRAPRSRQGRVERISRRSDACRSTRIDLRLAPRDHPRPGRRRARTRSSSPPSSALNIIQPLLPITMTSKSRFSITTVAISVLASANAFGQAKDTAQRGTVVVSATKVPKPASTLSQAVTVISGDDLRARGVTRVSDALREVPGASLVQSGSFGAITSLFLRGGESRYTKVLVDGVPVNASGGSFDFSNLTTDNIDRIEIVRGPASVLYGADAVSGVVQIFTRRASSESRASIGVRGGTYRSLDADADAAAENALGGFSVGAAHHSTDGILPFNNQYRNGTLSSALTLGHGVAGDARLSARYTSAEFHFPTDFTGAVVDTNSYTTQHRLTVGLDAGRNFSAYAQG